LSETSQTPLHEGIRATNSTLAISPFSERRS
jgi:hypothetical protein